MNNKLVWKKYDEDIINATHGNIEFYRDLYDGNHIKIFDRAKELITNGEASEVIRHGKNLGLKKQPPYIMANVAKLVVDIPAMLISRAIGKPYVTDEQTFTLETDDNETDPDEMTTNKILEKIHDRSNLKFEHWANITQQQTDGGIVGVVINDENGTRIDTKARDLYYPHEDGNGCDLVYTKKIETGEDGDGESEYEEFVHIHREYVEAGNLITEEMLYRTNDSGDLEEIEEPAEIADLLGMEIDDISKKYDGRDKTFVEYWANEKTFRDPLGKSALKNQEAKQEEINWTLTRNGIVFQRNGKPRFAVSKEVFNELQNKAYERYQDETKIDAQDLEITTFDDKGNSIEVIQIDTSKIGDIDWVKDLMKLIFVETRTSEKAVDFYLENGGTPAQSGVAKFYDLFVSIMKAEQLSEEYMEFLSRLYESAMYFESENYEGLEIRKPKFETRDMIPVTRKEKIETEDKAYSGGDGIQSLHRSVRKANPNWEEAQVDEEVERIEEARQSTDARTLGENPSNIQSLLDNRTEPLVNTDDEE